MDKDFFSKLVLQDKVKYLWNNGVYLEGRILYNQRITLYSVGKLFYEAYYDNNALAITRVQEISLDDVSKYYGQESFM